MVDRRGAQDEDLTLRVQAKTSAGGGVPEIPSEATLLNEAVERLVAALHPERIYLFGSRARGDAHGDSDYDFMVVVQERTGKGHSMERDAYAALSGLGVSKDVVVMSRAYFEWMCGAKASLPATVEREGRLLYAA